METVYIFILAGFVGWLVIARVPALLHTPLMAASINVVGGFLITDRMLKMFRRQ